MDIKQDSYKAIIFEPQMETAQIYAKYLNEQDLETIICQAEESLAAIENDYIPQVMVYNIEGGYNLLKAVKNRFPEILVITVANDFGDQQLDKLMALGVSSHVNRKVTHPRDVAIIARQLLTF